jgi:hypothetical protein
MPPMNRLMMLSLALALSLVFGCAKSDLKSMSVDDVAARIAAADGKTFIYDNNSKESYAEGHVPSARWVDYDHVTAVDLPSDKGATLIFYCKNSL